MTASFQPPGGGSWIPTHVVPLPSLQAWTAPDPSLPVAADLAGGLPVQVTETRGDWAQVLCSNGWTGWVDARRLKRELAQSIGAVSGRVIAEARGPVLTVGLNQPQELAYVNDALRRREKRPVLWVTEGEDPIGGFAPSSVGSAHYDLTGECRADHPHVAWLAASPDFFRSHNAATSLCQPSLRVLEPPPSTADMSRVENWAADLSPGIFTRLPLLSAVLFAAGCQGKGPGAAMDWLSPGQLPALRDYCLARARETGHADAPVWDALDRIVTSPERPQAVASALAAMAPLEEAIRVGFSTGLRPQALDVDQWLGTDEVIYVTIPRQAAASYRQVPAALMEVSAGLAVQEHQSLQLLSIWQHPSAAPLHRGSLVFSPTELILTSQPAIFLEWSGEGVNVGHKDWIIGEALIHDPRLSALLATRTTVPTDAAKGYSLLLAANPVSAHWVRSSDSAGEAESGSSGPRQAKYSGS